MKFIFFGTPEFAAIILEKLITAGFLPAAVVCNPDRPVGRKKIITPPPTKLVAQKYNIELLQPVSLEIENWKLEIKKIKNGIFDFFIVAAYGKILPPEIFKMPRLGTIGVHPSLLPKYRGASPIQSVIINGEEKTGTTLFLLDEKVDHGPILAKQELEFPISNFQFSNLQQRLAELSGDLLVATLPKFLKGEITPLTQDESQVTYTKKFTTEDGYVDLEKDNPVMIERKIRALNPEPGVWTLSPSKNVSKRIKILEV